VTVPRSEPTLCDQPSRGTIPVIASAAASVKTSFFIRTLICIISYEPVSVETKGIFDCYS
jgi:hypothetical protein